MSPNRSVIIPRERVRINDMMRGVGDLDVLFQRTHFDKIVGRIRYGLGVIVSMYPGKTSSNA